MIYLANIIGSSSSTRSVSRSCQGSTSLFIDLKQHRRLLEPFLHNGSYLSLQKTECYCISVFKTLFLSKSTGKGQTAPMKKYFSQIYRTIPFCFKRLCKGFARNTGLKEGKDTEGMTKSKHYTNEGNEWRTKVKHWTKGKHRTDQGNAGLRKVTQDWGR